MPFNTTLTDEQLTALRATSYYSAQYLSLCENRIIFAASVNQTSYGTAYATVTYNAVTIGAYTDLKVGMTVLISSTADYRNAEFVGRIRDANSTSALITINESSVAIAPGYFITVLDDYRIVQRLARDVSGIQFIDYSYGYFGFAPIINGLQSGYASWVNPATNRYRIAFAPGAIFPLVGSSLGSYLWDIEDGTLVTGTLTNDAITVDFPPGFRWITFRVTQTDGVFTDFRIPIWAHHPIEYPPALGFTGATISADERGYNASVNAFSGVEDVLDNTLVCVWGEEWYDGVSGSLDSNVQFVGRFQSEAVKTEGNEAYSTIEQDVRFELEGIGATLARTTAPILALLNVNIAAAVWDSVRTLTVWRAICYVLQLHSTLNTVVSLDFEETTDTFILDAILTQGQSLFECVNDIGMSINSGLDFAPSGEIRLARDARMLPFVDRSSTPTLATFEVIDTLSYGVDHPHFDPVGIVQGGGGCYDESGDIVAPVQSIAPGEAQGDGVGVSGLQRQILSANQSLATAQEEINERVGHYLALLNTPYTLNVAFPPGYWWLVPQRNTQFDWTIPADTNNRDIEFPAAVHWSLARISQTHNNETGAKTVDATFNFITSGSPGLSYIPPATGEIAPYVPYVPPNPTYPLFPEQPGAIYPGGTITTVPPLISPYPPGTSAGSTNVPRDGNGVAISDGARVWVCRRFKALNVQQWIEVTPSLLSGYVVRSLAWSKFNQRLYILASNSTDVESIVYNCPNGFASAPVWTASAAITGDYRQLKVGHTNGAVYIYSPDDSGTSAWCHTFDFTADSGSWLLRGDGDVEGQYNAGSGWAALTNQVIGGGGSYSTRLVVRRTFIPTTITSIEVTYNYTQGSAFNVDIRQALLQAGTDSGAGNPPTRDSGGSPPTTGTGKTLSWAGTLDNATIIQLNIWASGQKNTTPGTNGAALVTSVEVCGTGLNPFGGGGSASAAVRYSSNNGASFGAALTVGTSMTGYGGFDTNKLLVGSVAAASGQVENATTAGGAYAPYGSVFPVGAQPNALWLPGRIFGSASSNNTASTPEYLAASALLTATNQALWKVTATGATFTDITPQIGADYGLALSPNCIAMPLKTGLKMAAMLNFGGDIHLVTSNNAGVGWTDRGALDNGAYPRYRDSDGFIVELYFLDDAPYFSPNLGATKRERNNPSSTPLTMIEVFG